MKRIVFFLVASVLGCLVIPQIADGLPPCCARASCGWSCKLENPGPGWHECRQVYPRAERCSTGEGIESTSWCGSIYIGEGCVTAASSYCGGAAYTTGECDP
jgi:hypothetical protein